MAQCINACSTDIELNYQLLETGVYTITIISSLGERYIFTDTFTAGDFLIISPAPSLNESMSYRVLVEVDGGLEEILYFSTYPYLLVLN